jgi:putative oxidoreductase
MLQIGLFLLRLALGISFIGHGTQKSFGWLGGAGFTRTAKLYENNFHFRPGWLFTLLACLGEAGGGALLTLGLITPLAALLIFASMTVAIAKVTGKNGYWITKNGWEYNALIMMVCVLFFLAGAGTYSVDHLLGFNNIVASLL